LGGSNLTAEVGLAGLAELALLAFGRAVSVVSKNIVGCDCENVLESNDIISRLDGCYAFSN
jgi:hypothetical protein